MMRILTTLFYFEWLKLSRNRLMKWMLLLMCLCAVYAIYYGHSTIEKQLKNIAFVEQLNDSTRLSFYCYFDNQVTADTVRFGWAIMNSLYDGFTTEDFLENNIAVNVPNRLSHLSIGGRDVYPVYRKVSARSFITMATAYPWKVTMWKPVIRTNCWQAILI